MLACLWLLLTTTAMAQSISGVVYETGTRIPVQGATVSAFAAAPARSGAVANTGADGRYVLDKLTPATYQITVSASLFSAARKSKTVALTATGLAAVDFEIDRDGEISGAVVNEDGGPVPGLGVYLLSKVYALGEPQSTVEAQTRTDARGEYRFQRIKPGKEYFVLARKTPGGRKPALRPTYYPDALVLRSGEKRERVDIRAAKTQGYCIEARLEAEDRPGPLEYQVFDEHLRSSRAAPPPATAPADGKIRICDLPPGEYYIAASQPAADPRDPPKAFGVAAATIHDRDASNVVVSAAPRIPVSGETRWDGAPAEATIQVYLLPLTRGIVERERTGLYTRAAVPGNFQFPAVFAANHSIRVAGLKRGQYVKDITYGAESVLHKPLPLATPGILRVILANDGATVTVKAEPNTYVVLIPAAADSEASLAEQMLQAPTDQHGVQLFETVPPGTYYVHTQSALVEPAQAEIAALWRARTHFQRAEIGPSTAITVSAHR